MSKLIELSQRATPHALIARDAAPLLKSLSAAFRVDAVRFARVAAIAQSWTLRGIFNASLVYERVNVSGDTSSTAVVTLSLDEIGVSANDAVGRTPLALAVTTAQSNVAALLSVANWTKAEIWLSLMRSVLMCDYVALLAAITRLGTMIDVPLWNPDTVNAVIVFCFVLFLFCFSSFFKLVLFSILESISLNTFLLQTGSVVCETKHSNENFIEKEKKKYTRN